jgi:hypothetical protein
MKPKNPAVAGRGRRLMSRRSKRNRLRSAIETLERRIALAIHNEDFSDDFNPTLGGFDTWDADPLTVPFGDTDADPATVEGPDELLIPHQVGPLAAINRNRFGNSGHFLTIGASVSPNDYLIDFAAGRSQPGGLDPDGEVVTVGFRFFGAGQIVVEGDNGVKTLVLNNSTAWSGLAVVSNDPADGGGEVGAIQRVRFIAPLPTVADNLHIDDLSVLVLDSGFSNNAPSPIEDFARTLPGESVDIDFTGNDVDIDGDSISLVEVRPPANGSVVIVTLPGSSRPNATYMPNAGFHGIDSFEYVITDNRASSPLTATGTVQVLVNTPPPDRHRTYTVPHLYAASFSPVNGLLDDKLDVDGDPLTVRLVGSPSRGTVVVDSTGFFTYTPTTHDGLLRNDSFAVVVSDSFETSDPVSVGLMVENTAPHGSNGTIFANHGAQAPQALFGFADADGDMVEVFIEDQPLHGSASIRVAELHEFGGRVEVVYHPESGRAVGPDRLSYRLFDGYELSDVITVAVSVPNFRPRVNIPPGQVSQHFLAAIYELTPSGSLPVDALLFTHNPEHFTTLAIARPATTDIVLAEDLDGDVLRPVLSHGATHGDVEFYIAPGQGSAERPVWRFGYTPYPGIEFHGSDTFAFRVSDGAEESADEIFVTLGQSLGTPKAISDVFSFEGELTDGRPIFGDLERYEEFEPFQLDAAGILKFFPSALLQNDFFSNGFPADFFSALDPHIEILSTRDEIRYYTLYDGVGRIISRRGLDDQGNVTPFDIVPADEPLFLVPDGPLSIDEVSTGYLLSEFTYRFTYEHSGLGRTASKESTVVILATAEEQRDSDGVLDSVEANVPSRSDVGSDGDGNGIPDFDESRVASLPNAVDGRYVSIIAEPGVSLVGVHAGLAPAPESVPAGVDFPIGTFAFQLTGLPLLGLTTVTILPPPQTVQVDDTYYKTSFFEDHDGIRFRMEPFPYRAGIDREGGELIDDDGDGYVERIVLHIADAGIGDFFDPHAINQGIDGVIVDPGGPGVLHRPPRAESVVINDGSSQRSKINSITVTFNTLVTIDPGALELVRHGSNTLVGLAVAISEQNGRTVAVLTFSGHGIIGGSLFDGRYTLTIRSDKIRNASGQSLDGDGDGTSGGNRLDEFFRRYGDGDGDGDVDAIDRRHFLTTLGRRAGDPDYVWYFDFNGDGRVAVTDLLAFTIASLIPSR